MSEAYSIAVLRCLTAVLPTADASPSRDLCSMSRHVAGHLPVAPREHQPLVLGICQHLHPLQHPIHLLDVAQLLHRPCACGALLGCGPCPELQIATANRAAASLSPGASDATK